MKQKCRLLVFYLCTIVITVLLGCSKYEEKIALLTSIKPQQVIVFKIYSRVGRPVGEAVEFSNPDPIIEAFFQSLTELRAYSPTHDRAEIDRQWFLEVATGGIKVQIAFSIPDQKGNIVTGSLGEFTGKDGSYDGDFQSRQLYDWYQKYSHRWLEPEDAQPTPTLQP